MAHFSDDISALWGPADNTVLNPEPRPVESPARPAPESPESPKVDEERLSRLEERVSRMAESLDVHRSAVDARVAEEVTRLRAEMLTATQARLAEIEARVAHRIGEIGRQMTAALSRAAPGGVPAHGPEADRLDAIERQLHEGMTRLHRSVTAFRAQSVAKTDLDAIRSELRALVKEHLTRIEAEAAAAADARLATFEAHVDERLEAIPRPAPAGEAAAGQDARLAARPHPVEEDAARLSEAMDALSARFVTRTELRSLWDSLKTTLTENLMQVRAQAVADAEAHLLTVKAELEDRLRAVEEAGRASLALGEARADLSRRPRRGTG